MSGDGFSAEVATLKQAASLTRTAGEGLGDAMGRAPEPPDAGVSSPLIGAALQQVLNASVVITSVLRETAGKVDVSAGSYATIDNNSAGRLRWDSIADAPTLIAQSRENGLLDSSDMNDYIGPSAIELSDIHPDWPPELTK